MTDHSGYARESPEQDLLGAAERRVRENEQANASFQLALRLSNIAIWDFDMLDGNIDLARLDAVTGYSRDELLGKTAYEFTHPDDLASTLEVAGRLTRREIDSYAIEERYLKKDGSAVWVQVTDG
jgi:PAS domain S-box-containing protein